MKWHQRIATEMKSRHSDTISVVRAGKSGAKKRTNHRERRNAKKS